MNNNTIKITLVALASLIAGCATPYQKSTAFTMTGGYYEKDLGKDVWRIGFGGNGYINDETTQFFWLYRCCEVTIENGFDGFKVLSDIRLTQSIDIEEFLRIDAPSAKPAQYYPIYIPDTYKPNLEADIQLLKGPIEANPPRVFDAHQLKKVLEPMMPKKGKNVVPHRHEYIYPVEGEENKEIET